MFHAGIDRVDFKDLDGDGLEDLSVFAYSGKITLTAEQLRTWWDSCRSSTNTQLPPIPVKDYRIDFLFKDGHFSVAPGSRDSLTVFTTH